MSKWGENISGWWNRNKGRNIGDPITGLMPVGQMGPPQSGQGNLSIFKEGDTKGGDVITVIGGNPGGQLTAAAVGAGGAGP